MRKLIGFCTSPAFGFYVKFIAGFAAAGFGLLGVGAKTRNDDDSFTRKGWIALVGIVIAGVFALASVTYDYFVGQRAAKADAQKSQRLLLSVQRGIYPLRGITANFSVLLSKDFDGLDAYKASVRQAINSDRECKRTKLFGCDLSIPQVLTDYTIPTSSPLFPQEGSDFRRVLNAMSLEVLMFKRTSPTPGKTKYERIGSFNIDIGGKIRDDWDLEYDYDSASLFLRVSKYKVPDDAPIESKVYSLVDFVPGVIAIGNSRTTTYACHEKGGCDFHQFTKLMADLASGLDVTYATLSFGYPRAFDFHRYSSPFGDVAAMKCNDKNGRYLVLKTPDDIEAETSLSVNPTQIPETEKKQICAAVLTPPPEQPVPVEP